MGGVAQLDNVHLTLAGSHTLTASAEGYADVASASFLVEAGAPRRLVFDISAGAAHHLAFAAEPPAAPSVAGKALSLVSVRASMPSMASRASRR